MTHLSDIEVLEQWANGAFAPTYTSQVKEARPTPDALKQIAQLLWNAGPTQRVELYFKPGGKPIFLISANDSFIKQWKNSLNEPDLKGWKLSRRIRFNAMLQVLNISAKDYELISGGVAIDTYLVPIDWRTRTIELGKISGMNRRRFVRKLVRYTRIFNTRFETFITPSAHQ